MSNLQLQKKLKQLTPIEKRRLKNLSPYLTEKWYESLVEECQAIVVEGEFSANWIRVQTYHELGQRILEDIDKAENVDRFLEFVANDINRSKRTVYDAYKFAKKYPVLNDIPMGKNITWRKVVYELLPENPREEKETKAKTAICPECGHEFEI